MLRLTGKKVLFSVFSPKFIMENSSRVLLLLACCTPAIIFINHVVVHLHDCEEDSCTITFVQKWLINVLNLKIFSAHPFSRFAD